MEEEKIEKRNWDNLLKYKCPTCGSPLVSQKWPSKKAALWWCSKNGCGFNIYEGRIEELIEDIKWSINGRPPPEAFLPPNEDETY